jgi:hypothetical protein
MRQGTADGNAAVWSPSQSRAEQDREREWALTTTRTREV